MEAINRVCTSMQENHEWVSEFSMLLLEKRILSALNYDIDVQCMVQWELLRYSAPTSLNNDLVYDGVILEMYNKVIDMAIKTSFTFPFTQTHTPILFFLEAQRLRQMICTDGWVRRPE